MDHRLAQWSAQGLAPILQDWTARAIGLGGPCIARLPNETVNGLAEGLDGDGALLLRLPIGGVRRIAAGDVFFGAP
jgi:BirA family biotin operon repressor/biotin-[acetyl-CoA-carboxylase] ligase